MKTLEEKYKIIAEHIKASAGVARLAASMTRVRSYKEKEKEKWKNHWTSKIISANFYSVTEDHKKELEFEKTAPKRILDICRQCPYFSNAWSRHTPNKKLKNRYNCEQHSKAVVQEEFGIRQWAKALIPMRCPFCAEVKMQEWNDGQGA